jgi:hypothetical protein
LDHPPYVFVKTVDTGIGAYARLVCAGLRV